MDLPGNNLVYNGCFELRSSAGWPEGWLPLPPSAGGAVQLTGDLYHLINRAAIKVSSRSGSDGFTGIVQAPERGIAAEPHLVYELAAWLCSSREGLPAGLKALFFDQGGRWLGEREIALTVGRRLDRYSGLVMAPQGAASLRIACGSNPAPDHLLSELWIAWVTLIPLGTV